MSPLADILRPQKIEDMVGQPQLLAADKPLYRLIKGGRYGNMIFYGPSGVGKTTVARIIAESSGKKLHVLNATSAGLADIKSVISEINTLAAPNGILLYLDEIQYFNKKQQQSLLEHIENGSITLIASTTENPYFYVYNAILSRSSVFEFKSVEPLEIKKAVIRGIDYLKEQLSCEIEVTDDVLLKISKGCGGDVRKALNAVEMCVYAAEIIDGKRIITEDLAKSLSSPSAMKYDREGDEHYDILSAFQKSMRGSDADAALHYLARLLIAGDLPSACRRLAVTTAEDVGLAYPHILPIVKSCIDIALMVGLPEAAIPLGDAVILVAASPKSNSGCSGIFAAMDDIKKGNTGPIPRNLQNVHYDSDEVQQKGQNYLYPHSYPGGYIEQQYLPDAIKDKVYYNFGENKNEQAFKAYLDMIKRKDGKFND